MGPGDSLGGIRAVDADGVVGGTRNEKCRYGRVHLHAFRRYLPFYGRHESYSANGLGRHGGSARAIERITGRSEEWLAIQVGPSCVGVGPGSACVNIARSKE